MEFASEMVIRATREKLDVREIPIELHPRVGDVEALAVPRRVAASAPHPRLQPDVPLPAAGRGHARARARSITLLVFAQVADLRARACTSTRSSSAACSSSSACRRSASDCAPAPTASYFISEQDQLFQRLRARFRLEHGLLLAGIVGVAGVALFGVVVGEWAAGGFGALSEERLAILAATLIVVARADLLHVVHALDPRPAAPPRRAVATLRATVDFSGEHGTLGCRVGRARSPPGLASRWQSFEALGRHAQLGCRALRRSRSWSSRVQSIVVPVHPGRDMPRYIQTLRAARARLRSCCRRS